MPIQVALSKHIEVLTGLILFATQLIDEKYAINDYFSQRMVSEVTF